MPRSAVSLSRSAAPVLFCILCSACNTAKPSAAEQTGKAEETHAYHLADRVESAAAPAALAPASCGGGEQGSGDGACGASCGQEGTADHAACGGNADQAQAGAAELTRVDPSQVCMVRDHFMGRPQLAVQTEGSTYYGCCPGCANRLFKDAQARQAIDPVSHNPVDKSLAVLGKTARGQVLYFESEANFEAFRSSARTLTP